VTHAAPAVAADASDPSRHPAITLAQVLPLCAIAWGALAFGGVYAWAYWPLAGVCLLSGCLAAYVARDAPGKSVDAPLVVALTVLAGAILVQLFPLPIHTLSTFSPHTIDVLHKLNPAFAAGLMQWHAISVWPNDTLVAFGLYASLALLLVGTARLLSVTGSRRLVQATGYGLQGTPPRELEFCLTLPLLEAVRWPREVPRRDQICSASASFRSSPRSRGASTP